MRRLCGVLAGVVLAAGSLVAVGVSSAGATSVSTEAEFHAAWIADSQIDLQADITIVDCSKRYERTANAPVVLEGHGHTVTQTCPYRVLSLSDPPDGNTSDVTLRQVTLTGGRETSGDDGGAIDMNRHVMSSGGTLVVEDSTLTNNCATGVGNPPSADAGAIENEDGDTTIIRSTISGNHADRTVGAVRSKAGHLTIVNSTITGNSAPGIGGIESGGRNNDEFKPSVSIAYSTITQNAIDSTPCSAPLNPFPCGTTVGIDCTSAPDASAAADPDDDIIAQGGPAVANLVVARFATSSVFGSVIAQPVGPSGVFNCGIDGGSPPPSAGYNFSDDASCGFTDGTDKQSGGDPGLGALASNAGPTQTRLPQSGSPLIDAILNAACQTPPLATGITTDQRGLARPEQSGGKCDIGAVEVQVVPIVVAIRFTG